MASFWKYLHLTGHLSLFYVIEKGGVRGDGVGLYSVGCILQCHHWMPLNPTHCTFKLIKKHENAFAFDLTIIGVSYAVLEDGEPLILFLLRHHAEVEVASVRVPQDQGELGRHLQEGSAPHLGLHSWRHTAIETH